MHASVTLGRPFGIPVGIHWSMLVLGALATWSLATSFEVVQPGYPSGTYWTTAALVVALFAASIVAHELAHAVVARRNGLRVERITLWVLGGVAELDQQPATPGAEVRIAAAGPAASLVVAVVSAGLALVTDVSTDAGVLVTGLSWLAAVNAILAVFNLLPARPMDGGRILTGVLWWRRGDRAGAAAAAARVSVVLGWGLVGLGLFLLFTGAFTGVWLALIGWMVTSTARMELQVDAWRRDLAPVPVGALMSPPPPAVAGWRPAGTAADELLRNPAAPFFVVTAADGAATGLVLAGELRRAARSQPEEPIGSVARPLAQLPVAAPQDTLGVALAGPVGLPPVLVVGAGGRVVGQVTMADLARASLLQHSGPSRPWPPASGSPWPPPSGLPASTAPPAVTRTDDRLALR
jgi:Zn-dependent protease